MSMSIEELDATVRAFFEGRGETVRQAPDSSEASSNTDSNLEQQKQAQATLNQFKENPDAWLLVDKILESASYPQTKCKYPLTLRKRARQC
jgi:exportin-1